MVVRGGAQRSYKHAFVYGGLRVTLYPFGRHRTHLGFAYGRYPPQPIQGLNASPAAGAKLAAIIPNQYQGLAKAVQ